MDEAAKQAMLRDIIRRSKLPTQQDDEFTVTEFITAGGAENTSTAWRRLSRLVENGELTRRMVCGRENGRQAWAFRMVNERSGNAPGWRDGSGPDQE